jgi:tRNA-modifying protein YgfZ
MQAALLPDRGVVKIAGDEARTFLNGLLTTDIAQVSPQGARFGGLLTPQGKIIVDCIVVEVEAKDGGGFFLDCPRALVSNLLEKLKFYKLRAKVTIDDASPSLGVLAIWNGNGNTGHGLVYADPRLPALGQRAIVPPESAAQAVADLGAQLVDAAEYDAHRIALGVPHGGVDFVYGDAFPHEADMDQLNGIDFDKGCYVGQEVVSRMEHRGTARNRIVPVAADGAAPESGIPVMAGGKQVGLTGSAAGSHGLAMLRLDRVADAQAAGARLTAGGVTLHPRKPEWARFPFPGDKAAE